MDGSDDDTDFDGDGLRGLELLEKIVSVLDPIRERLPSLVRPAITMTVADTAVPPQTMLSLDEMPLGTSHVGGLPDLPPSLQWPMFQGRPLAHVVQINLADVASAPPGPWAAIPATGTDDVPRLPARGWFWLFLDLDNSKYWNGCSNGDGVAFLFWDGPVEHLTRRRNPNDTHDNTDPAAVGTLLASHRLAFARTTVMQYLDGANEEADGFTKAQVGALIAANELYGGHLDALVQRYPMLRLQSRDWQLLGHPQPLQDLALGRDEVLLLQLTMQHNVRYWPAQGATWAQTTLRLGTDVKPGQLYVLLERDALVARQFDQATVLYDC